MQEIRETLVRDKDLQRLYETGIDLQPFTELGLAKLLKRPYFEIAIASLCDKKVIGVCKDNGESLKHKEEARICFQRKDYLEAVVHYAKTLRHQAVETETDKLCASTLYTNRALCLMKADSRGQDFSLAKSAK